MTNDDLTFSSETQAIFGHIPMIPWDPPPFCLVPQNGVPPAHARRCTLALATRHHTGHGDCSSRGVHPVTMQCLIHFDPLTGHVHPMKLRFRQSNEQRTVEILSHCGFSPKPPYEDLVRGVNSYQQLRVPSRT